MLWLHFYVILYRSEFGTFASENSTRNVSFGHCCKTQLHLHSNPNFGTLGPKCFLCRNGQSGENNWLCRSGVQCEDGSDEDEQICGMFNVVFELSSKITYSRRRNL